MEYILILISCIAIVFIKIIMNINFNNMKQIATNEELNKITEKYPNNIEICKKILKMLNNEKVQIEQDETSDITVYLALQDKIFLGNTHGSFTRIQTIAHECLHSIQDKKILVANFIYSNIYLLYFIVICILVILKKLPNEMLFSNILLIISFVYYVIRIFLENDAMIKARYLAEEYMNEEKISSKNEIKNIVNGLDNLNKDVIKGTNTNIFINIMIKIVIFNVLALIF